MKIKRIILYLFGLILFLSFSFKISANESCLEGVLSNKYHHIYINDLTVVVVDYDNESFEFIHINKNISSNFNIGDKVLKYSDYISIGSSKFVYEYINGTLTIKDLYIENDNKSIISSTEFIDVEDGFYVVENIQENDYEYSLRNYYDGTLIYKISKEKVNLSYEYMELTYANPEFLPKIIYVKNGIQSKLPGGANMLNGLSGSYIAIKYYENDFVHYDIYSYTNLTDKSTYTFIKSLDKDSFTLHRAQILDSVTFDPSDFDNKLVVPYLCYYVDGCQINVNDIKTYYKSITHDKGSLLIDEEVFTNIYDKSRYSKVIRLNNLYFNDYAGLTGKVEVVKNSNGEYIFDLFSTDQFTHLRIYLNGFIPEKQLEDLRMSSFIFIKDNSNTTNLYFEFIFDDGTDYIYNVNNNKVGTSSLFKITSKDWGYIKNGNIYEYYIYFNSNIAIDKWLSIKYNYKYHKHQDTLYGINFNYAKESGTYELSSEGIPLTNISSVDKFLSKYIFSYDVNAKNNFGMSGYTVNDTFYAYRMKFLVVGKTIDDLISLSLPGRLINLLFFNDDGYIRLDSLDVLSVSYLKESVVYNNIVVESNVVIDPDIDPIVDPVDGKINKWSVSDFINGLNQALKDGNLINYIMNRIPAFIISIILGILILYILVKLIGVFVLKYKLKNE